MKAPRRRHGIYYGWVQVLTLSVTETISWGILYYAFAVFVTPMEAEFGWSRTQTTGAFSLALLVSGIAAVPAGRWLDRHGARLLMTAGSCAATALVLAWAAVDSLPALYAVWAGIGVAMTATLYEPAFVVVANWFRRYRSRALTVLTFGGGFASVVFIPLADRLVRTEGWRPALVWLAVILAVGTILPHALILRRHPSDLGLLTDGVAADDTGEDGRHQPERSVPAREALRGAGFWWLTASFFLAMAALVAVTVHLIPYLIGRGYDPSFAATAAGLVGVTALPGRLIFTPLGGWLPRRAVTAFLFLLQTASLVVLLLAQSKAGVLLAVALFGAGFGAVTPARAALLADLYGPAAYGSIASVLALFVTGARALAPVGASVVYTWSGGYDPLMWGLVGISAAAAGAVLLVDDQDRSAPAALRSVGIER